MNNIISQEEKDRIDALCAKWRIENYTINQDGSIDVVGGVRLYNKAITKIPLRFGKISGDFDCSANRLTTLEGCPSVVGGTFDCGNNRLTSLEGCPTKVNGSFYCYANQLISLEHCPKEVKAFVCYENHLKSLEHCPTTVLYFFNCSDNILTSLEHCPTSVGGFYCSQNELTTLEHCPTKVLGPFECNSNPLQTLMYFPKTIGGNYIITSDKYTDATHLFEDMLNKAFGDIQYDDDDNPYLCDESLIAYKYMNYFEVWTPGFNIDAMNDLVAEIKDGLQ
jgi:hypothetical protein